MEEIIFKYLNNEMNSEEEMLLERWLAEDPRNQQLLYKIESAWFLDQRSIDDSKSSVKNRVSHVIDLPDTSQNWLWLKAAAVLFFGLMIGVVVTYLSNDTSKQELTENVKFLEKFSLPGQKITLTLPDGSKVKMNSGSKLIVPEQFKGKYREVELTGEAYFDIKRDEKHPFIIRTGNLNVRVLGTAFNVRAYPAEENFKVAVAQGKVAVTGTNNQSVVLEKDEMAVYDQSSGHSFKSSFNPKSVFSWKDKNIFFENANIKEIISTLENWYGVEFMVNTQLDPKKDFSGEYHNKSLETVLKGLSFVYEFSYEIEDNQTVILNPYEEK